MLSIAVKEYSPLTLRSAILQGMNFWATVGGAILGSGVVTAIFAAFADHRAARRSRKLERADATRDALTDLDVFYRRNSRAGVVPDLDIAMALEGALSGEVDKCDEPEIDRTALAFVEVGKSRLSRDPDVSSDDFTDARTALRAALRNYLK